MSRARAGQRGHAGQCSASGKVHSKSETLQDSHTTHNSIHAQSLPSFPPQSARAAHHRGQGAGPVQMLQGHDLQPDAPASAGRPGRLNWTNSQFKEACWVASSPFQHP